MASEEYLTTGDVARILSISRSTVSRKFDTGTFTGKTNPITGERLIAVASLLSFIRENNLPIDPQSLVRRTIVLTAGDPHLSEALRAVVRDDSRIRLVSATLGADALVACSHEKPDLLILDDRITDLAPADIIASLRRRPEFKTLRVLGMLSTRMGQTPPDWGADAYLPVDEMIERGRLHHSIYRLAGLSRERLAGIEPMPHQRRWPRVALNQPGRIAIYRVSDPLQMNWGESIVQNVSGGGAFLSDIRLSDPQIPAEPFRLLLRLDRPPLENWEAHCQVVRMRSNGHLCAGVQFENITDTNLRKVQEMAVA